FARDSYPCSGLELRQIGEKYAPPTLRRYGPAECRGHVDVAVRGRAATFRAAKEGGRRHELGSQCHVRKTGKRTRLLADFEDHLQPAIADGVRQSERNH